LRKTGAVERSAGPRGSDQVATPKAPQELDGHGASFVLPGSLQIRNERPDLTRPLRFVIERGEVERGESTLPSHRAGPPHRQGTIALPEPTQRLFPRARRLHEEALKLARPGEVGIILLNQAVTLKEDGDPEGALRALERAAQVVDAEQQPRLRFGLRYNQASNLIVLNRARDAAPIVREVQGLAERLRNDIDFLRTRWLAASCAAGEGEGARRPRRGPPGV